MTTKTLATLAIIFGVNGMATISLTDDGRYDVNGRTFNGYPEAIAYAERG